MLNFFGRDSPPTIPNSSKLAARFQPDTRKCTEVQSTLSIRECNPSFNRVYVTSREDPSSPPLRGLPRSGRKNDCSSEVSSFLSLSNSAAGQPRDTVESLERKGKERKERKKEMDMHLSHRPCRLRRIGIETSRTSRLPRVNFPRKRVPLPSENWYKPITNICPFTSPRDGK